MRIASPKRQAVQSLGRHSVGNTGFEGDASLVDAVTDVASGLAIQAAQLIDKREQEKASLYMQKEDSAFWKQYGNKEFFDANELPQEFVTEGMQISGRVASAEVLPKMYEAHIKTSMSQASKMIGLAGSRNDWLANSKVTADGRLNKVQMAANTVIDKQIFVDQKINYTNALEARRPEVAYTIAQSMNTSDENRKVYLKEAKQASEIITYEDMITEERIDDMRKASLYLAQSVEDYERANGELDSTQRLAWKHKLDSELSRLTKVSTAENKYIKAQLEHDIATQIDLSKNGHAIDPDVYVDLSRRIEAGNLRTDGDYAREALKLAQAALLGNHVNQMNKEGPAGRWQLIDNVRNSSNLPPLEKDKLIKDLITANERFTAGLNSDFMGTVNSAGAFGSKGLSPINIMGAPSDLVAQFVARERQYSSAQQNYGLELGEGMFTVEEAKAMGRQLNAMSTQQQLGVIAAANDALGPESVNLFAQLGKTGDAGTFAVAGTAQAAGRQHAARTMLDGRKWRMENGKDLSALNTILDNRIHQELKNLYINQPEKYRAVADATKDAYYGIRQDNLDLTTQSIDSDDLATAIASSTGGTWEHAGKTLPVPKYGMNPRDMERWIEDTSWEEYKDNAPMNYPAETFWNDVQAGRLTLEPYREPGTYTVSNNGSVLPSNEVDEYGRRVPYLLRYDATTEKSIGWWNRTKDSVESMLK